jgi:enamine deaminase RidA (YjgF/YER057c/UK114 family)
MLRTPVNPWPRSLPLGYNQGEVVQDVTRYLTIAGQTSMNAEGVPQHAGDMRGQLAMVLDNLETVLQAAGMSLQNLTRLAVYTTDVDAALQNFDVLGQRLGPAGAAPPMTLIGVTRLAIPGLMIEIEGNAAA